MPFSRLCLFPALILLMAALSGCNPASYRQDADNEAYCIIQQKSAGIEGMPSQFAIEGRHGGFPAAEIGSATVVLTLPEAVETAITNSRTYQSEMERLYSEALFLSLERHEFDPIYFGNGSFDYENDDGLHSIAGFFTIGFNRMLSTGADLSVAMSTNLFRVVSGGNASEIAASALTASLVQPLMRGAGEFVTLENLTQAERDMVYAIRDFVRFRREFSVTIAQDYFDLLRLRDQVKNARNNFLSLEIQNRIVVNLAAAGMSSSIEVDQSTSQVLSARDAWLRSIASYERGLDLYKFQLGIPTDARIETVTEELIRIRDEALEQVKFTEQEATAIALENRIDLKNTTERVDDARRRIIIAEDLLKPGMDLILDYRAGSDGDTQLFDFADGPKRYSAGVDVDLPFDRKSERNIYRQSFINLAAALRARQETEDRIKLEIREALRAIELAERRYQIQMNSLMVAERRVERDSLLLEAGRAITRDVLESQAALLEAQDSVTDALVDSYNARLDLYLAMDTLRIDDSGLWSEGVEEDEWEYVDE